MEILKGMGVFPGIAIGQAFIIDTTGFCVLKQRVPTKKVENEVERFLYSINQVRNYYRTAKKLVSEKGAGDHAYILDTYMLMLEDDILVENVTNLIRGNLINAEWALSIFIEQIDDLFDVKDEYILKRKDDIKQVTKKILNKLIGFTGFEISQIKKPVVVVSHNLMPSDILQLPRENLLGFVMDHGGVTSHVAILSGALEIPSVIGLREVSSKVVSGDTIAIDGDSGMVIINPSKKQIDEFRKKEKSLAKNYKKLRKIKDLPSETADGFRVKLCANIENISEISLARENGAEGIGLFRSEYMCLSENRIPGENEQFEIYKALSNEVYPDPVTVRTFDIGGDKFYPYLNLKHESNPALGIKSIRLCLQRMDIFKAQLRAILRASGKGNLHIMFPMISGLEELKMTKDILEQVKDELETENIEFNHKMKTGIMIEVPSAAMIADVLAREVDFFSIGTNDLVQYALAVDRVNENVAYLYEPFHPAVLRLIRNVIEDAHREGIKVGVCGKMAGDPTGVILLTGLGVDELSMNPYSIPKIKETIRRINMSEIKGVVKEARKCSTADEVKTLLKGELKALGESNNLSCHHG